jgi:hypothetical protein
MLWLGDDLRIATTEARLLPNGKLNSQTQIRIDES